MKSKDEVWQWGLDTPVERPVFQCLSPSTSQVDFATSSLRLRTYLVHPIKSIPRHDLSGTAIGLPPH